MKNIAILIGLSWLVPVLPAVAETPIPPEKFEALTNGTTLYFNQFGQAYGAEQYLRNQKVIWTFRNGECQFGEWFGSGDNICFLYEGQGDAICWTFFEGDGGKRARVIGADPAEDLVVAGQDTESLLCPAPDLGVSYPVPAQTEDLLIKQ